MEFLRLYVLYFVLPSNDIFGRNISLVMYVNVFLVEWHQKNAFGQTFYSKIYINSGSDATNLIAICSSLATVILIEAFYSISFCFDSLCFSRWLLRPATMYLCVYVCACAGAGALRNIL